MTSNLIQKTAEHIKSLLIGEGSGHDWWHVYRVWNNAKLINQNEQADQLLVELGALLHDISDWKFNDGNEDVGPELAASWLRQINVDEQIIDKIKIIIKEVSFKGAGIPSVPSTIEGRIVQDADRLDAIGTVGIARCFAYGGYVNREIYNPEVKPEMHQSAKAYKNSVGTSVNHFYEKLLLLKDRMNTKTAKIIAEDRHEYMQQFLDRFFLEWEGYC